MINYITSLLLLNSFFAGLTYKDIKVTRWASPDGSLPTSYANWQSKWLERGLFHHGRVYESAHRLGEKIQLLINADLYAATASALDQYIQDLEAENRTVLVDTVRQGTPEDIRGLLQSIPALEGAVLIGDLPVAWFQMLDDFEQNDTLDGYEEFPIDLYYMDLDGIWSDSLEYYMIEDRDTLIAGSDGIFDHHSGNLSPEIWIGRLTASPLGNEELLVEMYFNKVHRYRQGDLSLTPRALIYVDNDWSQWAPEFDTDLDSVYNVRTIVSDPETTVADDYRARLDDAYEWISVFAHSWPGGHGFVYQDSLWTWFYGSEIATVDPQAFFYNLFACSNCRFVEPDYMGGRYIFAPTHGLAAVGTAKTGSMLQFKDFYNPLGAGKSLGAAFRDWFSVQPLDSIWARSWFYGMTLLGDPTLKPTVKTAINEPWDKKPSVISSLRVLPNPFSARTVLQFTLPQAGYVNLTIYDPTGRSVKVLVAGRQPQGFSRIIWDGSDGDNQMVAPGIYFCRLSAGSFNRVEKVVKIK